MQIRKVKIMDNAYQWVPFYEALAYMLDNNHSNPSLFTSNPTFGTGMLGAGVNEVWKLNGFYKCIQKRNPVELEA
jgi:hypothetical protein